MKLSKKRKKEDIIKFLKEIGCIAIGTIIGIVTYFICLYTHFDIFGWNFGLVLSPLFAGYAESYIAHKYLNESTGAVSAFILFIITVVYGFIIANPTLGFNIITAGSIVIIIQAAIPTATNYFLIAMFFAIISHILGIFKTVSSYIKKLYTSFVGFFNINPTIVKEEPIIETFNLNEAEYDFNNSGILLLSLDHSPQDKKIIEHKGIYEICEIFDFDQREELKSKRENELSRNLMYRVKKAENIAMKKLIETLKNDGCNGIIDLTINFESLGKDKGHNMMQVILIGTGVIFEEDEI